MPKIEQPRLWVGYEDYGNHCTCSAPDMEYRASCPAGEYCGVCDKPILGDAAKLIGAERSVERLKKVLGNLLEASGDILKHSKSEKDQAALKAARDMCMPQDNSQENSCAN